MTDKNTGGTAFPTDNEYLTSGMTLRDWFAGQALAGVLANPARLDGIQNTVEGAYCLADAMLAERDK